MKPPEQQLAILRVLHYVSPASLPTGKIAGMCQLPDYTARNTLRKLTELGLAEQKGHVRSGAGTPAMLWRITPQGADILARPQPEGEPADMADDLSQLLKRFEKLGCTATMTGKSHYQIRTASGRLVVTLPSSPGDVRSLRQGQLTARRMEQDRAGALTSKVAVGGQTAVQTHHPGWMAAGHPVTQCSPQFCGEIAEKLYKASQEAKAKGREVPAVLAARVPTATPPRPALAEAFSEAAAAFKPAEGLPRTTQGHIQLEAAKVYGRARELAEQKGSKQALNGAEGWVFDIQVVSILRALWPEIAKRGREDPAVKTACSALVEYLRLTGNLLTVGKASRWHATWWVRDAYHQGPDSLSRARNLATPAVTPKEHPEPVRVSHPYATIADRDKLTGHVHNIHGEKTTFGAKVPTALIELEHRRLHGLTEPPREPAKEKKASMPKTGKRRSGLSMEVLEYFQGRPGDIITIQQAAEALGASAGSVGTALRYWSNEEPLEGQDKPLTEISGIQKLTRSSYVYLRPTDGDAPPQPVPPAPRPAPAAPAKLAETTAEKPPAVEEITKPEPEPAGKPPLKTRSDGELFETIYTLRFGPGVGWRIIRDESGHIYELPPKEAD